jgi:hypothetical protein
VELTLKDDEDKIKITRTLELDGQRQDSYHALKLIQIKSRDEKSSGFSSNFFHNNSKHLLE